ncbi:MAG TPA: hypothetical protein VFQ77_20775 [Pseudonocardiaceae bacterium]|jgi:hypothetical protein|nr:hypothetical protein [Pseudonocardiaceae bacterium]
MRADDFAKLREDLERELFNGAHHVGILGLTDVALRLLDSLAVSGFIDAIEGIFTMSAVELPVTLRVPVAPMERLQYARPDVLVVASDEDKQDVLLAALSYVKAHQR